MSREIVILGVGVHPFGRYPGKEFSDMGLVAGRDALADAQVEWGDIELLVAGIDSWSGIPGGHAGNVLAYLMGSTGIPVVNVQTGCATGGTAFMVLCDMIASGKYDIGMAIGGSVSPQGMLPTIVPVVNNPFDLDNARFKMTGIPNPGFWAMDCVRRMHEHGTTESHLAKIRAKNSRHGALNPYARYRKVLSEDEVLSSPMVCYPFRLYEITALSDGAAAVIACSKDVARKYTTQPVFVAGCALASRAWGDSSVGGPFLSQTSKPGAPALIDGSIAADSALEQASLAPEDLDLIELQDATPFHELAYMEIIGICEEGEAEHLVDEGATEIGGKIPVNPSGGFLSFGEATPAMGIWQACEVTWQLRGQAGQRQVEGAKVGFGQTYGIYQNNLAFVLKR